MAGMDSTLHNKSMAQQGQTSDGFPLGFVTQSPYDMESVNLDGYNKSRWMQLNGTVSSADILGPDMKRAWPVGVGTTTLRTLAATPAAGVIASSPTYFVASAAAGTTAAQYSTDTASWLQTSLVSPASTQVNCLLFTTGASTPRWVFGCSGTTTPQVTTGDNPNSTWTACTGSVTTTLRHGLAHSPSLDLTCLLPDGAGLAVWTMPGTNTTFTSRALPTSATNVGICWDGTYFVIITQTAGLIRRSSTGTGGWVDIYVSDLPSTMTDIVSDGNGTIVASANVGYPGYVYVSKDSGSTWKRVVLPAEFAILHSTNQLTNNSSAANLSFANGKFIVTIGANNSVLFSLTGLFWALEPIHHRGVAYVTHTMIACKSNVYCGVTTSTAAFSATEDTTLFRRPGSIRGDGTTINPLNSQEYMKVRL